MSVLYSGRGYDTGREVRGHTLLTPPVFEPVSLDIVKRHIRLEHELDDTYLEKMLIPTARQWVEQYTRRALMRQEWRLELDCFPVEIDLVKPPVTEVESVSYQDESGEFVEIDADDYQTVITDVGTRIRMIDQPWPFPDFRRIASVRVDYFAGYTNEETDAAGDSNNRVPAPIKQAILLVIGHLYEHREETTNATLAPIPMGVEALLSPYRVVRFE